MIDYMPLRDSASDLIRIVEGRRGHVPMRLETGHPAGLWLDRPLGAAHRARRAVAGPDSCPRSSVELRGEDLHTVADFTVAAGQRMTTI